MQTVNSRTTSKALKITSSNNIYSVVVRTTTQSSETNLQRVFFKVPMRRVITVSEARVRPSLQGAGVVV